MHFYKKLSIAVGIVLLVACSNGSDTVDTGDNGTDSGDGTSDGSGNGSDNGSDMNGNGGADNIAVCGDSAGDTSILTAIATQDPESDPTLLDVSALQNTLANLPNGCAQAEPLPVSEGDTVADIISS